MALTRGLGQEFFEKSRVGLSRVGSGHDIFKFSRVGSGHCYSTRPDLTRPDLTREV